MSWLLNTAPTSTLRFAGWFSRDGAVSLTCLVRSITDIPSSPHWCLSLLCTLYLILTPSGNITVGTKLTTINNSPCYVSPATKNREIFPISLSLVFRLPPRTASSQACTRPCDVMWSLYGTSLNVGLSGWLSLTSWPCDSKKRNRLQKVVWNSAF